MSALPDEPSPRCRRTGCRRQHCRRRRHRSRGLPRVRLVVGLLIQVGVALLHWFRD